MEALVRLSLLVYQPNPQGGNFTRLAVFGEDDSPKLVTHAMQALRQLLAKTVRHFQKSEMPDTKRERE
jgi:hypothetical protein